MTTLLIIAIAALAAVLQAAFLSALAAPLSLLHLPLILVIGLITAFRFRDAIVAALAGGLALDALSAAGRGTAFLVMLAVVAALMLVFTRVLSHLSLPSFIGINVAGFLLFHLFTFVAALARQALGGFAVGPLFAWDRLAVLGWGLLLQTAASGILLIAATRTKKLFSSTFFIVR